MAKTYFQRVITPLLVAALLMASFATLATAADLAAPLAQQVRAQQVKGTISGGKFAKRLSIGGTAYEFRVLGFLRI